MADLLYRLARFSVARRRGVLAGWLALLALLFTGALALVGPTDPEVTIPGTESQQALDALSKEFRARETAPRERCSFRPPADGCSPTPPPTHR